MVNSKIDSFFKRCPQNCDLPPETSRAESNEVPPPKAPRIESIEERDVSSLERDPGLRRQISDYPEAQRDEIRRAYIRFGPYQPSPPKNRTFLKDKHGRPFLPSWYKLFPDWLEYSPTKNRAFCLRCFLFTKPTGRQGSGAFTIDGFCSWKKINGESCAFLTHVGKDPNSPHRATISYCYSLMDRSQHIDKIVEKQTSEQIARNRLRVKTTADVVKFLTFQACAFRGRDEGQDSNNRGNVIELIKLLAAYIKEVAAVVLENAPQNASYHTHSIQKDILRVFADKIQAFIREEINDARFCIIVDESRDESKREQVAIILRFIDKEDFVRERFFDIVHVVDTKSATLKEEICKVFSHHNLNVHDIRGQGYDGASNMSGEWAGLQALFSAECPFAYYIHCFAHRLQLALVAALKEVREVGQFFYYLSIVVNVVGSSCKRHDQLRVVKAAEIAEMLAIDDECDTGKGKNQIGTLKRAGDTRWGFHLGSICSLFNMYEATCSVLKEIANDGATSAQRAEASGVYDNVTKFEFVFIMHFMRELLSITDDLSQALQRKSQDILNAMHLVSTTKEVIQKFREDGWVPLFESVKLFCEDHDIEIPDMSAPYKGSRACSRPRKGITNEHYYRIDVFIARVDSQKEELKERFKEDVMELLILSSSLDPKDGYKSFKVGDICELAHKFYPMDFNEQEKMHLKFQLQNYEIDIPQNSQFEDISTLPELCQKLSKTGKATIYPLVDRLIRLVLTLPVATATSERAFFSHENH